MIRKIFEADLLELLEININKIEDKTASIYLKVMIAYYQGDIETLKTIFNELPQGSFLSDIIKLRLDIRLKKIDPENILSLNKYIVPESLWNGEIYFVQAMAFEKNDDDKNAREYFEKAHQEFYKHEMKRKAVKALLNALAAESRINPKKMMLANYFYLYKLSISAGATTTAAKSLLNISKEYLDLKAYTASLSYANEGLKLLEPSIGTIDYFLAIIHRAHLYLELNQPKEALIDYETSKIAQFLEVKAAINVLTIAFDKKYPSYIEKNLKEETNLKEHLIFNWKERLERICGEEVFTQLGQLEQRFLQILTEGPKDKFEIINKIYGDIKNISAYENRLKNMIIRIKKKVPDIIVFMNGKYQLPETGYKLPGVAV